MSRAAYLAFAGVLAGCKPNLDDTVSIVGDARMLAVRAGPEGAAAESAPGEPLTLTALYAGGAGEIEPAPILWAICDERKALAELGPVSPLCLDFSGSWFIPLGQGGSVTGTMPKDACQQFGSDVPAPQPDQPPGRPVDPDSTGGYYEPVQLLSPGDTGPLVTIGQARIVCTLASYSPDTVAAFRQRYHRNVNPVVASLTADGTTWQPAPSGVANEVAAGDRVTLEASWQACPLSDVAGDGVCGPDETQMTCGTCDPSVLVSPSDCTPVRGCTGAERYVVLDQASGALVDRREAMTVAWYATGGTFDFDRTGRSEDDTATTTQNGWRAPADPGPVHIWVVLRDDRGGVGWEHVSVDVK